MFLGSIGLVTYKRVTIVTIENMKRQIVHTKQHIFYLFA